MSIKGRTYAFDHVFGRDLSQSDLYRETAAPMLRSFMEGYNCTIMVYGQTGSGKTFTMGTSNDRSPSNQGLIFRFINDLYANLNSSIAEGRHISFQIKASYLEIYGEEVRDLVLDRSASESEKIPLVVRKEKSGRVFVQGQQEVTVGSAESALEVLSSGTRLRETKPTKMNSESSRSHAVFTLLLEQKIRGADNIDDQMSSKMTFVDLAGSERVKRTKATGQRFKEGIQTNKGLFHLGEVINALAEGHKHIPYRCSEMMLVTCDCVHVVYRHHHHHHAMVGTRSSRIC